MIVWLKTGNGSLLHAVKSDVLGRSMCGVMTKFGWTTGSGEKCSKCLKLIADQEKRQATHGKDQWS